MKKHILYFVFVFCLVAVSACKKDTAAPVAATPALGGIKKVLGFDATAVMAGTPLVAGTPVVPVKCQTAAYTAGDGEVAVISINASLFPSVTANTLFQLAATVDIDNSGTFTPISNLAMGNMSGGAVCLSVAKVYPLTAGKSYVFASEWSVTVGTVNATKSVGSATVLIIKQ
ncbi:MAG: hypothetical protein ACKOWL_02835 [Sphingobacteriaceae bacterium]